MHMENTQERILASMQEMREYFHQRQPQYYKTPSPFQQLPSSFQPWQDSCQDDPYQRHLYPSYEAYLGQTLRPQSFGNTSGTVQRCSTSCEPSPPPFPPQTDANTSATSEYGYVGESSAPCSFTPRENALPPSEIQKEKLKKVAEVLQENIKLKTEGSAGNLCQRLAKEAIFGKEIMRRCTPNGTREYPALPQAELYSLKQIMFQQFPRFHTCPGAFETVWKHCVVAIEQACKRLRA